MTKYLIGVLNRQGISTSRIETIERFCAENRWYIHPDRQRGFGPEHALLAIVKTSDGNLVVAISDHDTQIEKVIKKDPKGNILWEYKFDVPFTQPTGALPYVMAMF